MKLRHLSLLVVLLAAALVALSPVGASAFTTAANCALPGSTFQGGDGNESAPTLAEQAYCTEQLLPTSTDWQNIGNVVNTPDPQSEDNMFVGGNKETEPGKWQLTTAAGGVTPGKANIVSAWSQVDPQSRETFLYLTFDRAATTGDTYLTFELNKVKGVWNNGNANVPCRTTGDVLLSYNVQGSSTVNVVMYRWVTDESSSTVIPPEATPRQCATSGHFEHAEGVPVS